MQKVLYPDRVGDSLSHGLLSSPALNVVHRYGGSCDQQNYRDENPDNRQRRFFTHLSNSLSETLFYWTLGDGKELKAERGKLLVNWRLLRHIFGSTVGLFVSKRNKKRLPILQKVRRNAV